jgi:hypothetical protein
MKTRSRNNIAISAKLKLTVIYVTIGCIALASIIAVVMFIYLNLGQSEDAVAAGSAYSSSASGNWTAGATWSGGVAPGTTNLNGDDITVSANHTVQRTGNISTQNNVTLTIQANAVLTINGNLVVQNNFTLNNTGTLIITGSLETQNGATMTINGGGFVQVSGNVSLGNNADITVNGNFSVGGSLTMGSNSTFDGTGRVGISGSGCNYWSGSGSCAPVILPVELISFTAIDNGDGTVKITWETSSEKNNDYFSIQESSDGINYTEVTTVPGNGTSKVKSKYEYIHTTPSDGRQYYRLEQTDFDKTKETFSPVMVEVYSKEPTLEAFPNPIKGSKLTVNLPRAEEGTIFIVDHKSNTIYTQKIDGKSKKIEIILNNELAPGQYYLNYKTKMSSQSIKLLKE